MSDKGCMVQRIGGKDSASGELRGPGLEASRRPCRSGSRWEVSLDARPGRAAREGGSRRRGRPEAGGRLRPRAQLARSGPGNRRRAGRSGQGDAGRAGGDGRQGDASRAAASRRGEESGRRSPPHCPARQCGRSGLVLGAARRARPGRGRRPADAAGARGDGEDAPAADRAGARRRRGPAVDHRWSAGRRPDPPAHGSGRRSRPPSRPPRSPPARPWSPPWTRSPAA